MDYYCFINVTANKIVVDYGKVEDLFLLTIINTETGDEVSYARLKDLWSGPIVERFDGITDLTEIKQMVRDNSEGFVIRFQSGMRVKIKYEEYVRLHRLVTGINSRRIWEHLKNNEPLDDLLERVPDEFFKWVQETVNDLKDKFERIKYHTGEIFRLEYEEGLSRKELAEKFRKYPELQGLLFNILDKKKVDETIWKMIRPTAEKPWKEDIDA